MNSLTGHQLKNISSILTEALMACADVGGSPRRVLSEEWNENSPETSCHHAAATSYLTASMPSTSKDEPHNCFCGSSIEKPHIHTLIESRCWTDARGA